jgi:hypothetical protein
MVDVDSAPLAAAEGFVFKFATILGVRHVRAGLFFAGSRVLGCPFDV